MSVVVIGLNHRTVPLDVLGRTAVRDVELPKALHDLRSRPHIGEAVVLSTCNRTEIYAFAERYHGALDDVRRFISDQSGLSVEAFSDHLYAYHDEGAVAHLLRVVSGLDSAVVGEREILGQVRRAWDTAATEGAAGPALGRLFRHALEAGKRVRSVSGIAREMTSVAQAAVTMAARHLGGLQGRTVLVLGTGEVGEGMARALAGRRVADVLVASRTPANAAALAETVGGRPVAAGELAGSLCRVDALLTCTGSPMPVLSVDDFVPVMDARGSRPLLVVDVAVPRDVDASAATLEGLTLLDMDDLRSFADADGAERRRGIERVEAMLATELDRYRHRRFAEEVSPVVAALRERADDIRLAELERFRSRLGGLDARQREAVEALTKGLVNKLLHEPTIRLKEEAGSPGGERLADALRSLFDL